MQLLLLIKIGVQQRYKAVYIKNHETVKIRQLCAIQIKPKGKWNGFLTARHALQF